MITNDRATMNYHHTGVRSEGVLTMGLQWLQCAVSSSSCTQCNGPPYWDAVRRRFDVGVAMVAMCCLLFLLHTMQWTTILGCGQKEIRCWGCNVLCPLPPAHDAMDHHTGVRSEGDSMLGLQWLQCTVSSSSCTRCNEPPHWGAVRRRFVVGVAMVAI